MRNYVIASIMVILGLCAIAYQETLPPKNALVPYLTELSSAILVGGIISFLFMVVKEKESETTLRRLLRIHDSVDDLGLREILPESQGYNFTPLIENAGSLSIVMNDGLRWVGNNSVALQHRFSRKGTTEFFTVDPDSTFVQSLAAKTSIEPDDLRKKIHDTWQRLEECYNNSTKKGTLTIYRLRTYPTRSLFLTGNMLVETPYQIASGRANIPVYEYCKVARQDSPHAFASHDLEELRKEATVEKELNGT